MIHGKDYTITLDAGEMSVVNEAFYHAISMWNLDAEKTGEPKCAAIADNFARVWKTINAQLELSDNAEITLKACDLRAVDEALEVADMFLRFDAKQSEDRESLERAANCSKLRATIVAQVYPQDSRPMMQ